MAEYDAAEFAAAKNRRNRTSHGRIARRSFYFRELIAGERLVILSMAFLFLVR